MVQIVLQVQAWHVQLWTADVLFRRVISTMVHLQTSEAAFANVELRCVEVRIAFIAIETKTIAAIFALARAKMDWRRIRMFAVADLKSVVRTYSAC